MFVRISMIIVMALTLAGCGTSSHVTRSAATDRNARQIMIIHPSDIEPSVATPSRPAAPEAKRADGRHTVRAGETLWAISKRYGVDVPELARANDLHDSGSIEVGRLLIIPGASSKGMDKKVNYSARRSTTFIWPVRGNIASAFGSKSDKFINKGIDIRAADGASVSASRGGKVVYCDSQLKGFGNTVIIDHMDGYQTVYSYNEGISVKVGDIVEQRDVIARVGSSGRAREPMLHFEIRKNGEPQNPEFYLSR